MLRCTKRSGRPNCSVIGAVDSAIGRMFDFIAASGVSGGNGPAPDDPISVMCGGRKRAIFGSNSS